MPNFVGKFGQFDALDFAVAQVVENAKFDFCGVG